MLDIDTSGASSFQIADEPLVWRRRLIRVFLQNIQQNFNFGAQVRRRNFFCVFTGLFRKNNPPTHHSTSSLHCSIGVFNPSIIDSRIPGILRRYNVSSTARQSSSESKTALARLPVIKTGSWVAATSSNRLYSLALASVAVNVGIFHLFGKWSAGNPAGRLAGLPALRFHPWRPVEPVNALLQKVHLLPKEYAKPYG